MGYDERYRTTKDIFGREPEEMICRHELLLDRSAPVLDVGAGQGRNALYLARQGLHMEALDPSPAAIEMIRTVADAEGLAVRTHLAGFESFAAEAESYSGVLLIGLIPMLSWEQIARLTESIERWLRPGGLLFVTAFTTADASLAKFAQEWKALGRNSFSNQDGKVRTFLEPSELLTLFSKYEPLHHWEGIGPEHDHGHGAPERHAITEAVLRR